jgi:RNA polymerase sigma-70 factor (TIGR02943 family)
VPGWVRSGRRVIGVSLLERPAGTVRLDPQQWLAQHGDALWRYAIVRVRRAEIAEELLQETFAGALESAGRFRGECSERTWLLAILRRKIADHIRRSRLRRGLPEDRAAYDAFDGMFDGRGMWRVDPGRWPRDADRMLADPEFRRDFEACLSRLPVGLGEAFVMREVRGQGPDAICSVLEITQRNLWVRLHRARVLLRSCLGLKWGVQRKEGRRNGRTRS